MTRNTVRETQGCKHGFCLWNTETDPFSKLRLFCSWTCIDSYHMLSLLLFQQLECPLPPSLPFQILLFFFNVHSFHVKHPYSPPPRTLLELFLVCIIYIRGLNMFTVLYCSLTLSCMQIFSPQIEFKLIKGRSCVSISHGVYIVIQ